MPLTQIPISIDKLGIAKIITQILKEYRDNITEKVLKKERIKPWMRHKEIDIVEEILRNFQPETILEWGAGYSTLFYPRILKNARWLSIEHEKNWATKIKMLNQNPNVEIFCIQPNHFPWTNGHKDGAYSDLEKYLEFPSKFEKFDFILIDGRARKDCLIKAYDLVKGEGVVVLHDANREYYHEPFKRYRYQVLFKDHRKESGGLWIGSKGTCMNAVFDINRHIKVWQIYNRIRAKMAFYL